MAYGRSRRGPSRSSAAGPSHARAPGLRCEGRAATPPNHPSRREVQMGGGPRGPPCPPFAGAPMTRLSARPVPRAASATFVAAALACALVSPAHAQHSAGLAVARTVPPSALAAPRSGAVVLDGRLDDAAWAAVEPLTDFTQSQPREGEPATQRTEIRFLFDA